MRIEFTDTELVIHIPLSVINTGKRVRKPEIGLTPRQLTLFNLLCTGKCNKDIAKEMGISVRTVKFHLAEMYKKLGISDRQEFYARVLSTPK